MTMIPSATAQLDEKEIFNVISNNFSKLAPNYYHLVSNWLIRAYNVHKDNGTDPLFRTRPGTVVIKDNWKLHHYYEDNKFELYNLEKDISESTNLADINIEKKDELLSKLNNWRKTRNAPIPSKLNAYYDQKYVDSLMFLINKNYISGKVNNNE